MSAPADAGVAPDPDALASVVASGLLQRVVRVGDVVRLTGGSSREIWAFEAEIVDGEVRRLVLRRDAPGEFRGDEIAAEVRVMEAARRAGVPVPRVYGGEDEVRALGGIVMDRVDAETDPGRILGAEHLAGARGALAAQCGRAIGRLHRVPPGELPGLVTDDRLATYRGELDRLDPDRPVLELSYRWLADHRPPATSPVVVHGDFRLGNIAVGGDGLVAVFDWESAHLGDRLEDLGWIAVRSWRFGGPHPVGGFGEIEPFLNAYTAMTGVEIDRPTFDWAVHLNTWIWAVGCLQQADRHRSGANRSVDLAMVGRRVVEVERDLLDLMEEAS